MSSHLRNTISYVYAVLLFATPLIFLPNTSELFEFNKMLFVYSVTIVVSVIWISRMLVDRRIIFKKSLLNIPIVLFLISLLISFAFSMDSRVSLLGYYSRFHGGLLSYLSYSILYWGFISNLYRRDVDKLIKALFAGGFLVCLYAILQRLGIDKNVWIQDVQNRVFSTLGQPNWLAAYLTAIIPIVWFLTFAGKKGQWMHKTFYLALFAMMTASIIFTKSKSGFLGFAINGTFFGILLYNFSKAKRIGLGLFKNFVKILTITFVIVLIFGTPWSPSLVTLFGNQENTLPVINKVEGPALEVGGSNSAEIRKIVWKGAIDIWKNNPIVGSGVETFALSYYQFRPVEHNLVSEWDFLYNKAHNEYLNFAATTGTLGIAAYSIFLLAAVYILISRVFYYNSPKHKNKDREKLLVSTAFNAALLSGFLSIMVTNFFGFSVVIIGVLMFLLPGFSEIYQSEKVDLVDKETTRKTWWLLGLTGATGIYLLSLVGRYYVADTYYAKALALNDVGSYPQARELIQKAIDLSSREPDFWDEYAESSVGIALILLENNNQEMAMQFAQSAVNEADRAENLSPNSVNIKRKKAQKLIKLSLIDINYMDGAIDTLNKAIELAPTEAKLYYNLGVSLIRADRREVGIEVLNQTKNLRPNYTDVYYALGIIYKEDGEIEAAKEEFKYILNNIDPNNENVIRELESLNG